MRRTVAIATSREMPWERALPDPALTGCREGLSFRTPLPYHISRKSAKNAEGLTPGELVRW
ncbi:hypothetical protein NSND_61945 [Nitrospira sp. ND1]|nr:hypothetical protein NSND_61945 [Nitrospira sp. ND1]